MATKEETKAYVEGLVAKAKVAQKQFEREFTNQHDIDAVVRAAGMIIANKGMELAKEAVGETGMGDIEGKLHKMNAAAIFTWNNCKGKPSVGIVPDRDEPGVRVLAKPMGVIGCLMPSTNPIATVIANSMMNFKCRNAVIIAAHPKSAHASIATANAIREAVAAVGAPADIIQCIDLEHASLDATMSLLPLCDANIGTGGANMVKAVYSTGRPGFGVGQGNCQDLIDVDYPDLNVVAAATVAGRSFDRGVPCIGDQTLIVPASREEEMVAALQANGAYLLSDPEAVDKIRRTVFPEPGGPINRGVVGRTPHMVGEIAGVEIPEEAKVLLIKNPAKGEEDDLCREILCPIMRYTTYDGDNFQEAIDIAVANLEAEGAGHSSAIWSKNDDKIMQAGLQIPVGRFHVEQNSGGSPQNGIPPTTTIGCGTWGGNSISENLQWYHLYQKTKITTVIPDKRPMTGNDWEEWE